ncbi:hypothetical protein BS78_K233200 [Paspalum vaginatum]|uniref:RRM domain-containing protein n=1 Tax=Paspalum vaginatum TaxID=158149 RepID=A0A9W7XBM3_9POAL|nr:hypothetical protein BS78_K233200 [Paspalum vaginatum]
MDERAYLPWLLAPPDASSDQKSRCVLVSSETSIRHGFTAATETVPYQFPSLFNIALVHPGDSDWTVVRRQITSSCSFLAYSDGKIVICDWHHMISLCTKTRQVDDLTGDHRTWSLPMPAQQYDKALLIAVVLLNHAHYYEGDYHDQSPYHRGVLDKDYYSVGNFAQARLTDCVMFLGRPSSFAVDAARFGMNGTCCAYFVVKNKLYDGIWGKSVLERCRVFKYLPTEWGHEECMWLTQQPSIASTELGPYFRIYVGNLPRRVDSNRLRQFFSKHGKVADARVMCHVNTKRSRGFGFVTLATTVDDEPSQAIAKLDGKMFDGRPMRVKSAD